MRKTLFIITAILFPFICLGQKMPSDYFDEAETYYENGNIKKALRCYEYVVKRYPHNKLYPKALYNSAYCSFQLKKYKKTIKLCRGILSGNFYELESSGIRDIMSNPYANYKNRASSLISDSYFELQQWDSALYYLSLCDTVYKFVSDCGNAYAENDVDMAVGYAKIYEKMNQKDKAIEKLLTIVFKDDLAYIDHALEYLRKLLAAKTGLKQELDKALENTYSKTVEHEIDGTKTYKELYYFKFLNAEIQTPNDIFGLKYDKERAIYLVKKSKFYKMISEM